MQSTTEISQKGLNDMKELNIMEATVLTSPNPLTLICSKKGGWFYEPGSHLLCVLPLLQSAYGGFRHWQTVPHRQACA